MVFVPGTLAAGTAGALAVGAGVVVVGGTVAVGVPLAALAVVTQSAIEASHLLRDAAAGALDHLQGEYDEAVRARTNRARRQLLEEAARLRTSRSDTEAALQTTSGLRAGLPSLSSRDLLGLRLQEARLLAEQAPEPGSLEKLEDLEERAADRSTDVFALLEECSALESALVSAAERAARAQTGNERLQDALARSEQSLRRTIGGPFVSEATRTLVAERLSRIHAEAEARGLSTAIRTIRTLEGRVRKEVRDAQVREIRLRRAWAAALSAVTALSESVPDARTAIAAQDLRRRLGELASDHADLDAVDKIAREAESLRSEAVASWRRLQVAAEAQALVAATLGALGYEVGYVPAASADTQSSPLIVKVDDRHGVRFTSHAGPVAGIEGMHAEMVAFDAEYAVVDDESQDRVCKVIQELATGLGARGFTPNRLPVGAQLDVVTPAREQDQHPGAARPLIERVID